MFTEEVIDRRITNTVRTENLVLETVDYIETRGNKAPAVPFQTCALERERVVYQIGTGDATNALKAAQVHSVRTVMLHRAIRGVFGSRGVPSLRLPHVRWKPSSPTALVECWRDNRARRRVPCLLTARASRKCALSVRVLRVCEGGGAWHIHIQSVGGASAYRTPASCNTVTAP